jgi:hypothetical protein
MIPHFPTVAGAAQAFDLFPVSPTAKKASRHREQFLSLSAKQSLSQR